MDTLDFMERAPHCHAGAATLLTAIGLVLAAAGWPSTAWADTFRVDRDDDSPFATACEYLVIGDCSLRGAILRANANPGADTIVVQKPYIQLTVHGSGEDAAFTGDLDILDDVTITTSAGLPKAMVDAALLDRVFHVHDCEVYLSNLDVVRGQAPDGGGGILNFGELRMDNVNVYACSTAGYGGGVDNQGFLEITSGELHDNIAEGGGAIANHTNLTAILWDSRIGMNAVDGPGGGVYNEGQLFLFRCAVEYNHSSGTGGPPVDGGGLYNRPTGSAYVDNSTFAFNYVVGGGGGIFNVGDLILELVTVAGNVASGGAAIQQYAGDLHMRSTLVEGDCDLGGGSVDSSGGNLESPGNTCGMDHADDQTAVGSVLFGDYGYHGGPTPTFSLLPASPAVDAASSYCQEIDQRSFSRPEDGDGDGSARCDVGAFEYSTSLVFIDGFESDDTDGWSSTTHPSDPP